jgi:hypothetical protein
MIQGMDAGNEMNPSNDQAHFVGVNDAMMWGDAITSELFHWVLGLCFLPPIGIGVGIGIDGSSLGPLFA